MNERLVYAEVYEILNLLEKEYAEKVPQKFIAFLDEHKSKEYMPKFDANKSLMKQNLQRGTIVLLTMLSLNYWCESQEEKSKMIEHLKKNDKIRQAKLQESYNVDDLFKNKPNRTMQIVVYEEPNWVQKLIRKIVDFVKSFRKKKGEK